MLVVAAIAGLVGYMLRGRLWPNPAPAVAGLGITPETWATRVGGRQQFTLFRTTADGKQEDVTSQAVLVAQDPKIVRVNGASATGYARSSGETVVHFYCGSEVAHATVRVQAAKNPAHMSLEPGDTALGVGTTAAVKVVGEYEDGTKIDLTEDAQWTSAPEGIVYCSGGRLEGMGAGEATVTVRFCASAGDSPVTAEAHVKVLEEKYQSLEVTVAPATILEGKAASLEAAVVTESGQKRSLDGSSQLKWEAEPADLAAVEKEHLRASHTGQGKLKAAFRELSATADFQVVRDTADAPLIPHPTELQLAVGEVAEIQVAAHTANPVRLVSSSAEIADVLSGCRVVGRAVGKAEITVSQEAREARVPVEVTAGKIKAIHFVPPRVTVPVDGFAALRLVGSGDKGQEIDLAPDKIAWEQLPTATFAELKTEGGLRVRGRAATGDTPQSLIARWGDSRATALINVLGPAAPPGTHSAGADQPARGPSGEACRLGEVRRRPPRGTGPRAGAVEDGAGRHRRTGS